MSVLVTGPKPVPRDGKTKTKTKQNNKNPKKPHPVVHFSDGNQPILI
jgi:hypothetical protein